jgi:CBS domain-containing protein
MRCEEIMTRDPETISIDASVIDAARVMAARDVGFVPLVDGNGMVVGTVTDRDIVVRCVAKGIDPRSAKLKEFGQNDVICCAPHDPVSEAEKLMAGHKVQRILVCEGDHGRGHKAIGVISFQDLAKVARDEIGETVKKVKEDQPSVH